MRSALVLALLLASCGKQALSASDARAAAQARMVKRFPSVARILDRLEANTQDLGDRWRVTYITRNEGLGAVVVDVDKRTGDANIVDGAQ